MEAVLLSSAGLSLVCLITDLGPELPAVPVLSDMVLVTPGVCLPTDNDLEDEVFEAALRGVAGDEDLDLKTTNPN